MLRLTFALNGGRVQEIQAKHQLECSTPQQITAECERIGLKSVVLGRSPPHLSVLLVVFRTREPMETEKAQLKSHSNPKTPLT